MHAAGLIRAEWPSRRWPVGLDLEAVASVLPRRQCVGSEHACIAATTGLDHVSGALAHVVAVIARHALTRQLAHVTAAPKLNGGGRARELNHAPTGSSPTRRRHHSTLLRYMRLLLFRLYSWSLLLPRMCSAHPSWVISA